MIAYAAILFDFDYTLADSTPGIVACINDALAQMGRPTYDLAHIAPTIGLSLPGAFAMLTGDGDEGAATEFQRLFGLRADEIMADRTTLYPWTLPTLLRLAEAGLALGVVSTKYHRRLETVFQRDGLYPLIGVLVGGEDVLHVKPAPDGLLLAAQALRVPVESCLYVGDTLTDAQAAQAAGMSFAAVLTGVTRVAAFGRYPSVAILGSVAELPDWLTVR